MGVIVFEVKDWVKLRRVSQGKVEIERQDGEVLWEQDPVNIAREYARNLAERFKSREELLRNSRRYPGKLELKFPWRWAAILPNIERAVVQQCETIWEPGQVLAMEDLTPKGFEHAVQGIPSVWRLDRPLPPAIVDIIRGVIQPEIIITDSAGRDIGTQTITQQE